MAEHVTEICGVEEFNEAVLLARLKRTRLLGHGKPLIYADADLRVEKLRPNELHPAQHYLLLPSIRQVRALRDVLLGYGIDNLQLTGGAWITTPHGRMPVIPPIVEASVEPDGRTVLLINDGLHRVALARELNMEVTVVVARCVPPEFPYYAFPNDGSWRTIKELEELPDGFQKKSYRQPTGYQALYRNFNADDVFPGVQPLRKNSNPEHLKPGVDLDDTEAHR